MTKIVIQDKTMLFLLLFVAFFVGAAITAVFSDYEAEAKKPKIPSTALLQIPFEAAELCSSTISICADLKGENSAFYKFIEIWSFIMP